MAQNPPAPDPTFIFADRTVALGFSDGVVRIGLAAEMITQTGERLTVRSGLLALTVDGALELQASLHQLLSQLDQKGVLNLRPPRMDG